MGIYFIIFKIFIFFIIFEGWGLKLTVARRRHERQLDLSYGSPTYKFCECGRKNEPTIGDIRVVGGTETAENEYPWMALITSNESKLLCGGSLINDRYVLTAAHCLSHGYREREIKVVLGEYDICEADTQTVRFSIEEIIAHPNYNKTTEFADIMLVRLNMRVTFNKFVRPICLPKFESRISTARKFGRRFATALGWGYADIPRPVCTLRAVNLEIFQPDNCPKNVATAFCAGLNDGGRDTCAGDSGGPLQVINSKERYELIGVSSTGIGCGSGYPGLYTDVVAMVPWIMKITTQNSMYCWR